MRVKLEVDASANKLWLLPPCMHLAAHMNMDVEAINWESQQIERGFAAVFSKGGSAEVADNDVLASAMKDVRVAFLNGCGSFALAQKMRLQVEACWRGACYPIPLAFEPPSSMAMATTST